MTTIGNRMIDISGLSQPVRAQLKQAKSAEDVQKIIAADGKIDSKEKAVLEAIETELGNSSEDGNQTLTFKDGQGAANSVAFGKGMMRETVRAAGIQRLSSKTTEGRADVLRTASDTKDLKAFLEADQKLAGSGKTQYGTSGAGAAKVLMQDAFLLEKFGVLSSSQKEQLNGIVNKLHTVKGFTGGDGVHKMEVGTDAITPADIQALDAMVKDCMGRLDGSPLPKADVGKLNSLSTPEAGSPQQQFQTVVDNLDGINAETDAAIHDLQLSYSEMGGGDGGKLNAQGRSFGRIQDAVQQVDQQMQLLKTQVMPSMEKALPVLSQDLQDAIVAKKPELKGKDKSEILAALNDPAVSEDPGIKPKNEKMQAAMAAYAQLGERMNQLSDAKIKGLTRMSSLGTIVREEKERTSAVNSMAAKLGDATGALQQLQNDLEKIGKLAPEHGKPPEKLSDFIALAQKHANTPVENLKSAEAVKAKLGTIRNDMITGMKGLIKTYETSGTANATATQLLKKELATLEALKTDDPDQALEVLGEVRQHLISELGKQVGPLISKNEYMSLTGLDKKVTAYADADRTLAGTSEAKIEGFKEQIEEAKAEKAQTLERTVNTLSKFADEKLAYGSHAQVNASFTVGLGVGTEKLGVYAGVGVQGVARIGKEFGIGPVYRATVDLEFLAEFKASCPVVGDIELKYRKTLMSGGVGFREMDQARNYVSSVNRSVQAEVNVAVLEQALKNAKEPMFSSVDPKEVKNCQEALVKAKAELADAQKALKDAEQYKFELSNDKTVKEGKAVLNGLHAEGKASTETNILTYSSPKEGMNRVEEKSTTFQTTVNHYGMKVMVQNQTQLEPDGTPGHHTKDRYGFYMVIPPEKVGQLLSKGASMTASLGKATVEGMAGQIVAAIGKIDPGAGITSAMVIAMMEKQWATATATHAKDLHTVSDAAHGAGHGGHDAGDHKFHQEFLVGAEFIYADHKFQYAAVEAAYEGAYKTSGRFNIPAGPIPLQGRWTVGFEAEVGVVVAKVKSNDYKANQFMNYMRDLKPGMEKKATGAEMLMQYASEPKIAEDKKIFEYAHGTLKDLRAKFPELGGLDDTETMKKCLTNPDKYFKDTFFEDVIKYPRKAPSGDHVVG